MSVSEPLSPPWRLPLLRRWLPAIILLLAAAVVTGFWTWPAPDMERWKPNVGTMVTVLVTMVLLLLWLLLLSGWTWKTRRRVLGVCLLIALGLWVSIREIRFTGHMRLLVVWLWTKPDEVVLEEQRQAHSGAAVAPLMLADYSNGFPEYRGRRRDGVVEGPALARDWQARRPRLLWKQPVGAGYAAFAVAGNLAVTIEQRRDHEVTVAYDTANGAERWSYSHAALFSEFLGGRGPRATPTIADGRVYSLGGTGQLLCLDTRSGKLFWQVNILENNDNLSWGMCGSPLVFDNYVVVSPGKQKAGAHTLVAYDRLTGNPVWVSGETRAGYSSPMLATLAGVRQILLLDAESLAGYDPATGQHLWSHEWKTENGINVAQPVVLEGDRIFIASGYAHGCAMLKISHREDKWDVQPLWGPLRTMRCKFTSPVAYREHLYGLDEGVLVCLDAATGKRCWREGRYDHGQLLLAGDLLVIQAESGDLALVEATPERFHELGRIEVFDERTWNNPALAGGKAYLRSDKEMACYDLAAASP